MISTLNIVLFIIAAAVLGYIFDIPDRFKAGRSKTEGNVVRRGSNLAIDEATINISIENEPYWKLNATDCVLNNDRSVDISKNIGGSSIFQANVKESDVSLGNFPEIISGKHKNVYYLKVQSKDSYKNHLENTNDAFKLSMMSKNEQLTDLLGDQGQFNIKQAKQTGIEQSYLARGKTYYPPNYSVPKEKNPPEEGEPK